VGCPKRIAVLDKRFRDKPCAYCLTNQSTQVVSLTGVGEANFSAFLGLNAKQRVHSTLGNGAFSYEGAQGTDYPEFSIWRISIYGGLKLCGDPMAPMEEVSGLGIITVERQFLQRPNAIAIFG
jgi:hypothetical protein